MDVIYCYDGSFEGFLSCVFDSYAHREIPAGFHSGEDGVFSLFDSRTVLTDPDHAARVLRKIAALSPEAAVLLRRGFLTCLPEKELHLFHLAAKLLREGPGFLRNRSDETLFPVIRAVRHLNGEVHLLKGFVRFSDLGGVLGGEIEPKNRVLPVLGGHFAARFHNERFFLYDRTHKEALFHVPGQSVIRPLAAFQMAPPDEAEARYRLLWKRFYDTIAIKERENPRLRMSNMPKRYWGTMTEFQGEDWFKPRSSPGAASIPGAPAGRSAPETLPPPEPSAPGSGP
ncbi:TIGR03915 family putative DNA repair protein [Oscillibacter sp.]|uniref:TIGR03915 family putative DNA repair protein n=1 Tax=Oscillibacter sp. TaxID=1945593 RepID=UPI002D8116F5|nr:TIGR03915 family putative DNA repair protein [Oscillibacter sp.]